MNELTSISMQMRHNCMSTLFKSMLKLKACPEEIQKWMSSGKLKLNSDKTEFIQFCSNFKASALQTWCISLCQSSWYCANRISPALVITNLGVLFDSDFSFSSHAFLSTLDQN